MIAIDDRSHRQTKQNTEPSTTQEVSRFAWGAADSRSFPLGGRALAGGHRPEITIVMAAFNAELYLAEAVESVLAQTTSRLWELLIVDDGSRDRSVDIVRQYIRLFPGRIAMLQHPGASNCGASASRNLALAHARGEFLAFLDADDVWLPGMLDRQVGTLCRRPEIAMVYANAERWWDFDLPFDPARGPLGENTLPPLVPRGVRPGLVEPPGLLDWFRADETMAPCTCTVVVRTAAARGLGGFVDRFQGLFDDQAFYAKFALNERIWVNLDCVARYRRHAGSTCVQAWEDEERTVRERGRFERWLAEYRSQRQQPSPLMQEALTANP